MIEQDFSPACFICNARCSVVKLFAEGSGVRFVYGGLERGNGSGDTITLARAEAIKTALTGPTTASKLSAADIHAGNTGFCRECSQFYCREHWQISITGGGRCPEGHFESIDPHW
jgi:hypothetical protein